MRLSLAVENRLKGNRVSLYGRAGDRLHLFAHRWANLTGSATELPNVCVEKFVVPQELDLEGIVGVVLDSLELDVASGERRHLASIDKLLRGTGGFDDELVVRKLGQEPRRLYLCCCCFHAKDSLVSRG